MDDDNKIVPIQLEVVQDISELPIDLDGYMPTQSEQRMLWVLIKPESRFMTVTQICDEARISDRTYYLNMKKPQFKAIVKQLAVELVKQHVVPLIHAGIVEAKKGNFQFWKALMEMGEVLNKDEQTGTITIRFADPNSDE